MKIEVEISDCPDGYIVLDTIVLLKVLNPDGSVVFREHFGKGLNIMEKYAMVRSAADSCGAWITQSAHREPPPTSP